MTVPATSQAASPTSGRPSILLVDDEPLVLEVFSRSLRRLYHVVTAANGAAGLTALKTDGPFAVVVSDMRMPGMDGGQFLARARASNPDTVRVLLTGQADIESAVAAVNEGQIFRFLQKPCPPGQLEKALAAAVELNRLTSAEHELLEKTLRGSVEVMTHVLALVSPVAFARSLRLQRLVAELSEALAVKDRWAIELAAMLSELGAITVPPDVLQRYYRGETLNAAEREMITGAPDVAEQLIGHLPRLEPVREILRAQRWPFDGAGLPAGFPRGEAIPLGARLMLVATDFDVLESRGDAAADALDVMDGRTGMYDPRALRALRTLKCNSAEATEIHEMRLIDVRVGMIFARDVVGTNGLVLIGRGQEATPSLVRRIRNFWVDLPLRQAPELIIPRVAIETEARAERV
jgi:response regulator RpfG family c-di-GMP phosphodiesterase